MSYKGFQKMWKKLENCVKKMAFFAHEIIWVYEKKYVGKYASCCQSKRD